LHTVAAVRNSIAGGIAHAVAAGNANAGNHSPARVSEIPTGTVNRLLFWSGSL
jgi:hypothetical protein